jgi:hypothetical protein
MSILRLFTIKNLVLLTPTLIVAAGVYAFAAANVVPESGAGDGTGTISGYTVTNVTYDTNDDGDPATLDEVTFDIAATASAGAPTEVFVEVDAGTDNWFSCADGGGGTWACTITSTNTVDADALNVVAAQ